MSHIPYLFLLFWHDIYACFFEQSRLLHVDIVDIVILISSTVLSHSMLRFLLLWVLKTQLHTKNVLGNGTLILTISLIITTYPSFQGCLHTIWFVFGYKIKWYSWKLNRLQLFHGTVKTVWNFYYIVFKSSSVTCSNVLSAPNKHTLGSISFVSSWVVVISSTFQRFLEFRP